LNIDACLRDVRSCSPEIQQRLLDAVPECRKLGGPFAIDSVNLTADELSQRQAAALKKHAYFCGIVSEATQIPKSIMVYISIALNFILISYIWCFVFLSHLYFAYARNDLTQAALNVLLGCFIILVTWFPFRAYSEWYLWYGNLSHMVDYSAYWVLMVFAIELLLLYVIWAVTQRLQISVVVAVQSAYGVFAAVFAAAAALKPQLIEHIFAVIARMAWPFHMLLVCCILLAVGVYARTLLRQSDTTQAAT
jgi:NADH:ubiquinone oxidoreductase subunit 3 (subunit A)